MGSDWNKAHPEKMRAASRRWRGKNPKKVKAANARPGRHKLSRYGITEMDFDEMLVRQGHRCLGCQKRFDNRRTINIDHDHATGRVRGLLCHKCNMALGMVLEDKATLTRLRSYLDYDRTRRTVYLMGSLSNFEVPVIGSTIRSAGFVVYDDWFGAGPEADKFWQNYELQYRGRDYAGALRGLAAQNTYLFDRSLIDLADIGVLVMPAGRSGHLELGHMSGQGKPTYILQTQDPEKFDVMPQFAKAVVSSVEDLLVYLREAR